MPCPQSGELAVLMRCEENAQKALCDALASIREPWEPKSTARNLRLIREVRQRRNEALSWAIGVEEALEKAAS